MKKFNKGFLLGAATAAHQVEGNNKNSDCWVMEHMKYTSYTEPSLDAVDHYNRYEEDIKLLANAGLNAYRFSIEWARIEPEEGNFNNAELDHYRNVINCCKENGVEPIITLHHFSSPAWLIRKGGWEAESTVGYFSRYTRYVIEGLGDGLRYVCTINEANMGIQIAAISKLFMQQAKAMSARTKTNDGDGADGSIQVGLNMERIMEIQKYGAEENKEVFGTEKPEVFTGPRTIEGDILIMRAHQAAKAVIKEVCPHVKVGLTLSLHDFQALPGGEEAAAKEWADEFTHYLPYIQGDDFLGVQNYTRTQVNAEGTLPAPEGAELTQMNYEFYPEAIENVIRTVAEDFKGELIVTENGIATGDNSRRVEFINRAAAGVQRCIADGLPVKGYLHWSLLDNFEWQMGFRMTFGLIAVDRTTQERKPKESLTVLGNLSGAE